MDTKGERRKKRDIVGRSSGRVAGGKRGCEEPYRRTDGVKERRRQGSEWPYLGVEIVLLIVFNINSKTLLTISDAYGGSIKAAMQFLLLIPRS